MDVKIDVLETESGNEDTQPQTLKARSPTGSDHCHTGWRDEKSVVNRRAFKKLLIASLLCLIFMLLEIIGGVFANSLAIATDAAHLFTDLSSFCIGLLAIYLSSRPPSKRLSFGWYRAEVLGAMLSVLTIWLVTVILVYMAVLRVINEDYEINALIMMITAGLGIVFNLCMMFTLGHSHSHSHNDPPSRAAPEDTSSVESSLTTQNSNEKTMLFNRKYSESRSYKSNQSINVSKHELSQTATRRKEVEDLNVRAALIHVIGDLVQSVGVFIASLLIYFKPSWKIADPICTFIFSLLVLITTLKILRDIIRVLMEGTPTNISFNEVKESLSQLEGVKEVHNLRIWSLTTSRIALAVHLVIDDSTLSQEVLSKAYKMLQKDFNIEESTVQVEVYVSQMDDCAQCKLP